MLMATQRRITSSGAEKSGGPRNRNAFKRTTIARIKSANSPSAATFEYLQGAATAISRIWKDLGGTFGSPQRVQEEHSHRVALFGWRIANLLGLPPEQAGRILRGGYLHDVGWVCVPGPSLLKPGSLSAEERMAVHSHPYIGFELLRAFLSTEDLSEMALLHHERFDGEGYPNGLRGTRIPIEARVLSIADSLDAMMSPRPYRNTFTYSQAMAELIRAAGKQFDSSIVEVLASRAKTFAGLLGPSLPATQVRKAS